MSRFFRLVALALAPLAVAYLGSVGVSAQETGIPAQIVDFTPDSIGVKKFPTTKFDDGAIEAQGTTKWRVVSGTGNAAELWFTISEAGRLLDLGGRYINYTDDLGKTWKSVTPLEPLANAEGSVVQAPNGDILGVTWDAYSGDRVITYKYSAAEETWYYNYNPVHTPFWDRPYIGVVPGPFDMPLGEVPYISFIHGLPHDPWYYSYDGLNYAFPSSPMVERGRTAPVESFLDVKPNDSYDWIQPNLDPLFNSLPALGKGRAISDTDSYFSPDDMQWHAFSLPNDKSLPGDRIQVDSRGRLHAVRRAGSGFEYLISDDGGRSWEALVVPDAGSPGDFRANAAAGVAAVWVLKGKQDNVYKFDIRHEKPKLMRHYVLGLGDDPRVGSIGTYGVTGGHRWDFSSLGIFPDGRIAVSFMDSTTLMKFPTLATEVVAPALAIELESHFPD